MPSLELIGGVVERSLDSQERRIASLDQRGGVLLGFSGLLATLVLSRGADLTWWSAVSGVLAFAAAGCAARVIAPRSPDLIRPRTLIEHYAAVATEEARFRVLSTLAVIYDQQEDDVARVKRRPLVAAILLLLLSLLILLTGSIVTSQAVADALKDARRSS